MKKFITFFALILVCACANAQTFKVNNLNVVGATALATPPIVPATCSNILSYGGSGNGVTSNVTAFTAAVAASPASEICVYFPPGNYVFASSVTVSISTSPGTVTIYGAGSESTFLTFNTSGAAITINYKDSKSSLHFRDLSMLTLNAGGSEALDMVQTATFAGGGFGQYPLSDISNVTFRGGDGWNLADYWAAGVHNYGTSNINYVNDTFYGPTGTPTGIGILLDFAPDHSIIPVVDNIVGNSFTHCLVGLEYAGNTQGVTVSYSNFTANIYGIQVPSAASNVDQLSVTTSQFNNIGFSIDTESITQAVTISNNFFLIENSSAAINLNDAAQFSIVNNVFSPSSLPATNQYGINIGAYAEGAGVITGNSFDVITTGIRLLSGSGRVNVQSNAYAPTIGTAVTNAGSGNTLGGGSQ